jgi:regulatory protein
VPTVTRISEVPRKPGRYLVEVDGHPFATVSAEIIGAEKLFVGAVLGEVQLDALQEAAADVTTYDRALSLLAFRSRSARELRRRLVQKGEVAERVDRTIERLTTAGLLDDAEYARQVARSKLLGQGASKRRLAQELFKRGVAREVADEAIGDVIEDESVDEQTVVEGLVRKKLRSLSDEDPVARRRRLYGFLARRGYSSDVIRRALQTVLHERSGDSANGGDYGDDSAADSDGSSRVD